jgi:hypothetical protein
MQKKNNETLIGSNANSTARDQGTKDVLYCSLGYGFRNDFGKYADDADVYEIREVWNDSGLTNSDQPATIPALAF